VGVDVDHPRQSESLPPPGHVGVGERLHAVSLAIVQDPSVAGHNEPLFAEAIGLYQLVTHPCFDLIAALSVRLTRPLRAS